MTALPFLADTELSALCAGLEQSHAQIKYLRGLGLRVERKPNGRPLLMRSELERVLGAERMIQANDRQPPRAGREPDMGALLQVIKGGKHGQKAHGR